MTKELHFFKTACIPVKNDILVTISDYIGR